MRTLELESQTELLDRLRLITQFGSSVISITGPAGSGLTWLTQRYLEKWVPEKNQSLLICHANQSDAEQRLMLLNQLFANSSLPPSQPLTTTVVEQLEGTSCDIVIVVDDAEHMTLGLVAELMQLVATAQHNPQWSISVLLFHHSEALASQYADLLTQQGISLIEMDVEPLTLEEKRTFLNNIVYKSIRDSGQLKLAKKAAITAEPTPGALMALTNMKKQKRVIIQSLIASPKHLMLGGVALVALIVAGYWGLTRQTTPEHYVERLSEENNVTGSERLAENATSTVSEAVSPTMREPRAGSGSIHMINGKPKTTEDTISLPPQVTQNMATLESNDDQRQRVVIPDTVVDALLEDSTKEVSSAVAVDSNDTNTVSETTPVQPQEQARSAAVNTTASNNSDDTQNNDAQTVIQDQSTPSTSNNEPKQADLTVTPSQTVDSTPSTDLTPPAKVAFASEALKSIPATHYTLQLAALTTLVDVQAFIEQYQLTGVRIYPTVRNEINWYIVTYQDFTTLQQARDATKLLPQAIQDLGPWPKSIRQVHTEIDLVD